MPAKVRSTGGHLFATLATGAAPRTAPRGGLKLAAARPGASYRAPARGACEAGPERPSRLAGRASRRRAPGRIRPGTEASLCAPIFELIAWQPAAGRGRAWPSHLGASARHRRNRASLDHDREACTRLGAAAGRRAPLSASLLCAASAGEAIILVRGDAPPDHVRRARAAADARRPRSGPRPRPPRAGSPCRSPDRRSSWRGVPCRDHRSPAA